MSTLRDPNVDAPDETTHADVLRETMVGELREMGTICSDRVADAFRAVPRHLFAPGAPLAAVYAATTSVVTKRDDHGVAISSVSVPELQAFRSGSGGVGGAKLVVQRADGGGTAGWRKCGEVVFEAVQHQFTAPGAHGVQPVQGNLCGGYHPVQVTGRDVGPG